MTKSELVNHVATTVDLSRAESDAIVSEVFNAIVGALRNGDSVELRGFGRFGVRVRPERQGRNPRTGEPVRVPEKSVVFFKPAKQTRDAIAGS